ncbi:MAG: 3-deoxy-8-phosphooctulonate synthase [Bacteroidales bacterium]|nr:3-deoxy-8-phosphooctulonate synthase [Bacteroidales bacterium]
MVQFFDIQKLKRVSGGNFFLIAGPCVVESEALCMQVAREVCALSDKWDIPYIFKASYRKANRSRGDSFVGLGDEKALEIVQKVGEHFDIPTLTDIHLPQEAALAASFGIDVLQIPAFLCRQTDLLEAAAATGKVVNIKKGQFMSPDSMRFAAEKVSRCGNPRIMLTDRGTQFGYADLIVDFRGIAIMKRMGYPVVLDITHSLQQPNQASGVTGGQPEMIATIARAAVAAGVDGLFLETHPKPDRALSDGANMLRLDLLDDLFKQLVPIHQAIKNVYHDSERI